MDVTLHTDAIHRGAGQIMPPTRRCCGLVQDPKIFFRPRDCRRSPGFTWEVRKDCCFHNFLGKVWIHILFEIALWIRVEQKLRCSSCWVKIPNPKMHHLMKVMLLEMTLPERGDALKPQREGFSSEWSLIFQSCPFSNNVLKSYHLR